MTFDLPFPRARPFNGFLLFGWTLLLPASAFAQEGGGELLNPRFTFSTDLTYAEDVPSPADFLGYELGTRFTFYADVVRYIEALADASDRVTLHAYGETYEGRPLHYLVVTSPAQQARIDTIRQNNLRLATGEALGQAEARSIIEEQPVVVWLSYNVHGNEPSSTEAAMQVAYRLAAAQDSTTARYLENAVTIIDPAINPDGRDRYVYWYTSMQSDVLSTDPMDLEHDEPWPGGRTNHYWFDLNRDWVWLVHPESQGRIAAYQQWLPQVHVDYHEQGFNNNYFTHPGTTPRNLLLPDAYDRWSDAFGQADAEAFDEARVSYFTGERFDFFYPGYGSSYPSVMGAIGMLREQGGHSRGGRAVETEDGYVLTLRQRVFDHYTTSMAALETSVSNREALLRYFREAFSPSTNESDVAAYLLPEDAGTYLPDVLDMLLQHGVRVERADSAFAVPAARSYWNDDAAAADTFAAGTYIVSTDQPRHLFINSVMQQQMAIEDSVMYDMATWSIPLAYNLEAYTTTTPPNVPTSAIEQVPEAPSGVENADAQYAYVIDWQQRHAPKALAMLWEAGYRVRSARKAFNDGTRRFGPGTLVVLLGRNYDKLDEAADDMRRIASEADVEVVGFDSGRMEEGIDLASTDSRPVEAPKVLLMTDSPFSSYTAGQLWYVFDRETALPVTRLRTSALADVALDEYDVLVLPGAGDLGEALDSTQMDRLKRWVQGGGTLVATENSALFLTKDASGFTDVEQVPSEDEAEEEGEAESEAESDEPDPAFYTRYEALEDSAGLARIPGSAFRAHLDTSNPLAFGMPERLYSLRFSTDALEPSEDLQTVGYYGEAAQILAAGYASQENQRKLAGKAFAAVQPMGEGEVVLLVDNTQYRLFWIGPMRLVQNAVMLLPGM